MVPRGRPMASCKETTTIPNPIQWPLSHSIHYILIGITSRPNMREEMAVLDQYVAPGLRLWMLIGLVSSVLLVMIVIVCCFVRLRIPRTKRQIELRAAKRRKRKAERAGTDFGDQHEQQDHYRGGQTIVLNSFNNSGTGRPNNGGRMGGADLSSRNHGQQSAAVAARSIPV